MAMAIGRGSPVMSPWVNKSPAASGLRGRQGFYSARRGNAPTLNDRRADLFRAAGTMAGRAESSQALHIGSASGSCLGTLRLPILRKRRLFRESEKVTLSAIELVGPTIGR